MSSISFTSENTRGPTGGHYKGTTGTARSTTFKQNIQPDRGERHYLSTEPKDDRTYGERVDDRLEAGYRAKAIRKDVVKMVGSWYNLRGRYHRKAKKYKSRR